MPFFSIFSSNTVFGICAIALLICTFTDGAGAEELAIKKDDFPSDFLFGAATSALQIEGSASKGGKGPSIWDNFVKLPDKVKDGSNITTAIDSYNRYKEDVKLLKELGVDSYRFSIAWTRILPNGSLSGGINQEGIDYYNNLIDELIKNGIEPLVTIFHFDSPQALQDKYGGFLSKSIVDDFVDYCEVCFLSFGDRVKHWITINEPLIIAMVGHNLGKAPPGRCSMPMGICPDGNSATEPYIVSHNILLAHAAAARLYKENFQVKQHGEIGIALVGQHSEPYSESPEDIEATERSLDFYMGWYLDPLVNGDYPSIMRKLVKERLPIFTEEEKEKVKGSFDFIGINYYTSRYAKGQPVEPNAKPISFSFDTFTILREDKNRKDIGELAEGSDYIYVYPKGLQNLLQHIKKKYKSPKIYITGNGVTEARNDDRELNESLNDQHRIKFIKNHLYYVNEAIQNGVNVKGYFYWSLFDSFELWDGYTVRFGLYYVDYKNNLERIAKQSATWYRDFLHSNQ